MDELIQNVVVVVDVNASIGKLGRVKCRIKGDSPEDPEHEVGLNVQCSPLAHSTIISRTQFCFLTSCFYLLKESESIQNEAVDLMERSRRNTTIQEAVRFYLALTGRELKNSKCAAHFYDVSMCSKSVIFSKSNTAETQKQLEE